MVIATLHYYKNNWTLRGRLLKNRLQKRKRCFISFFPRWEEQGCVREVNRMGDTISSLTESRRNEKEDKEGK